MSADVGSRRLVAILAADVVGYSRMIAADETATLNRLRVLRREIVEPLAAENGGRIFKTTGDGLLAEFPSTVQALRCAIAVQERLRDGEMQLRIGLHQGDVVVDGDDLLGDGVNIAARIEPLAEPGGICISGRVREDAAGKIALDVEDIGEPELKNIAQRHRVFRVRLDQPERPALALPDKPSIAVLPFQNMSGDPEQEYFADGMVEEIITGLSRVRSFFVIARNSSFAYKGKSPDVRQVGRELGVRYVLEGSVRKAGHRVRITGQLVDATSGAHLWADRFDSALEDIFELQDRVTASVIGAIEPRLEQAEIERIKRKPTANLDAYDYFLRGSESVYRWTDEAIEEGLRLLYRAIELDPDFAAPYALATFCYCGRTNTGTVINREQEIVETTRLAQRAVQLGKDDAFAFCWAGFSLARVVGKLDDGAAFIDRALALNPNLARAWNLSGWVRIWLGEPDIAIEHLARAMRLSPLDRAFHAMQAATAAAHFHADRYDEASAWAEKALRENPLNADAEYYLAASNALAGRLESAQQTMARLLQISPTQRLSNVGALAASYRRPEDYARWLEGLRRAGMPE